MRRHVLMAALIGALFAQASRASAQQYPRRDWGVVIDIGVFYDDLDPYGDWVEMPDYGWCFAPRVDREWRPYTHGQWVMTDDGWFWDSDERFGWAAYHYGRWVDDPYYGWIWVPGTEWAPAWVSWRYGRGYIGWAPLPPRAVWQTRVGLRIGGLDLDAYIGARDYIFVEERAFVDRGLHQYVLPPTRNVTIINVTSNVTNYTYVNQRVVNVGVPVTSVERAVGRSVPRARAVDVARADQQRRDRPDEIAVFRPRITKDPGKRPAKGRSLVKGEAPPPQFVERRKAREEERRQGGREADVTAKQAEQQRTAPGPRTPPPAGLNREQKESQPPRDRGREQADRQQADRQRATGEQQRIEREKAQANDQRQREQGRQQIERQKAGDEQQRVREKAQANQQQQQQRDLARQQAEQQRATGEQQRIEREKAQANDQRQREQGRQQIERQKAGDEQQRVQREKAQANQQQQQQRERQQAEEQKRERDARPPAGRPAADKPAPERPPDKPAPKSPPEKKGNPKEDDKKPKPKPTRQPSDRE